MRYLPLVLGLVLSTGAHAQTAGQTWTEPKTGLPFVWVPKGCFQMGTEQNIPPPEDTLWPHLGPARNLASDEQPRHEVCVDGFWISKFETRKGDWQRIMGAKVESQGAKLPVAGVSWAQARSFAERLTGASGGKFRFRLPTEAEWEYACRAGSKDEPVPSGREATDRAWYNKNEDGKATPREAGKLAANAFGLHDMLGNVWEWAEDSYRADAYARHALYNPRSDGATDSRVIRGGSHRSEAVQMRCAKRGNYPAAETLGTVGFRLVRSE